MPLTYACPVDNSDRCRFPASVSTSGPRKNTLRRQAFRVRRVQPQVHSLIQSTSASKNTCSKTQYRCIFRTCTNLRDARDRLNRVAGAAGVHARHYNYSSFDCHCGFFDCHCGFSGGEWPFAVRQRRESTKYHWFRLLISEHTVKTICRRSRTGASLGKPIPPPQRTETEK